ncbi:unnamed protein product [Nesidiocoris tenuis]|uniref:Uncharacterized protein n=1 Tax=Nesidiocoris tenuis TaxID=355587 RepID=A0A6H5FUC5_9HEMI|nr:unnamed protein product [Nesidiocoris tenuis]
MRYIHAVTSMLWRDIHAMASIRVHQYIGRRPCRAVHALHPCGAVHAAHSCDVIHLVIEISFSHSTTGDFHAVHSSCDIHAVASIAVVLYIGRRPCSAVLARDIHAAHPCSVNPFEGSKLVRRTSHQPLQLRKGRSAKPMGVSSGTFTPQRKGWNHILRIIMHPQQFQTPTAHCSSPSSVLPRCGRQKPLRQRRKTPK